MQHTMKSGRRTLGLMAAVFLLGLAVVLVWTQQGNAGPGGDPSRPGAAAGPSPASSAQLASGNLARWWAANNIDTQCTSSDSFADMPGMTVTFTTARTGQRVLIQFQGEWFNGEEGDRSLIRATVDGVVVGGPAAPGAELATNDGTDATTNGFNFISDQIHHPGAHTATIQWASVFEDGVCVDERSLIVLGS